MPEKGKILKKFKVPSIILVGLVFFCVFSGIKTGDQAQVDSCTVNSIQSSVTFTDETNVTQDQVVNDSYIMRDNASVTVINSTINGDIYAFNSANLTILQNSTINGEIFISDNTTLFIDNSIVVDGIQCGDTSNLKVSSSTMGAIQKDDVANVTAWNSTIYQIIDVGSGGLINVTDCQASYLTLTGYSQAFINNSTIGVISDFIPALGFITGPLPFEIAELGYNFSSSEREVNFTWIGFDNLIIDGYLNISFQILVDGELYKEINGSGFYDHYEGQLTILFNETGEHNITLISIDERNGLSSSSTIPIDIIDYPVFDGITFWISSIVIAAAVIIVMWLFKTQQDRGFQSALDVVFMHELKKNKFKSLIFVGIGAAPGIIMLLAFASAEQLTGSGEFSMDGIRSLASLVFSMFNLYFGLAFSMAFASGLVSNDRKTGSLSWFLSKPVRRSEYLWGKILAVLLTVLIISITTSASFMLCVMNYVDPLYIPDVVSIGGFMFLTELLTLLPLAALIMFFSTALKQPGLVMFLSILIVMILPIVTAFLPMATRHEWPMLLSLSYYSEQLAGAWISQGGGFLSSIGSMGQLLGIEITTLDLTIPQIIIIISSITIVSLVLSTIVFKKGDIA